MSSHTIVFILGHCPTRRVGTVSFKTVPDEGYDPKKMVCISRHHENPD
jgi:hypothetical protein